MALNDKRRIFVEEYLATWNASEAARRAGYAHPGSEGHRLLKIAEISEEISRRVAEKTLTADEVLVRLGEHARGSMGDFAKVNGRGQPYFDLQAAQQANKLHLIKKLKTKTRTINIEQDDEEEGNTDKDQQYGYATEVTIEFELYDAQAALVHIGKHHGLFKEGPSGTEDDPLHIRLDQ